MTTSTAEIPVVEISSCIFFTDLQLKYFQVCMCAWGTDYCRAFNS